jgi:26S proteasome regulatory subunit N10
MICFIGGPIQETTEALIKIGKQLKKNNVAVDIISIGEIEENNEKLSEFVNSVNSNDNWYYLICFFVYHYYYCYLAIL